jgi:hypothetical protein
MSIVEETQESAVSAAIAADGQLPPMSPAQIDHAVQNSIPHKSRRIACGLNIPVHPSTPADLAARIEAYNSDVKKLYKQLDGDVQTIVDALADGTDIESVLGALKLKKLPSVQAIVKQASAGIELAEQQVEALKPVVAQRDGEAEQVVAAVKADLERAGSGVESMPGYEHNGEAAAARFDNFARTSNIKARAAIGKVADIRAELAGAAEKVQHIKQQLVAAQQLLRVIALDAVQKAG